MGKQAISEIYNKKNNVHELSLEVLEILAIILLLVSNVVVLRRCK